MKTNTRNKKISLLIVSITGIFLLSTLSEPPVSSGFSLIQGENNVFNQVSLIDVVAAIDLSSGIPPYWCRSKDSTGGGLRHVCYRAQDEDGGIHAPLFGLIIASK